MVSMVSTRRSVGSRTTPTTVNVAITGVLNVSHASRRNYVPSTFSNFQNRSIPVHAAFKVIEAIISADNHKRAKQRPLSPMCTGVLVNKYMI